MSVHAEADEETTIVNDSGLATALQTLPSWPAFSSFSAASGN